MPSKELTAVVYLTAVGAPASYPVAVADRVRHLGRVLGAAGVVGVLATALILAGVATPAAAAPGESIASYDTRIQVSADGRMRIIETIVYDFGANSRHGLIRRIPATFRYDRTHDRVYPIDEVGVTMDGSTVPVERSAGDSTDQAVAAVGAEVIDDRLDDPHPPVGRHLDPRVVAGDGLAGRGCGGRGHTGEDQCSRQDPDHAGRAKDPAEVPDAISHGHRVRGGRTYGGQVDNGS